MSGRLGNCLANHRDHFSQVFFHSPGDEGDAEAAVFDIVVGAAIPGEFYGGAHFFENPEVVVEAAFGDAELVGTVGGFAGGFQMDEIVEADESI